MVNRYERRVARGAAYLNEHLTFNWIDRIDLWCLNVDSPAGCVLGQLYSFFFFAPQRLESVRWLLRRGFIVPGTSTIVGALIGYRGGRRFNARRRALNEAWRTYVIRERMKIREQVR